MNAKAAESTTSSTFSNSVHWIGARLCSGLSRVGVLLVIARVYGPSNFGELSLAISLTEIFRTMAECGLDTIAIRKFRQSPPSGVSQLLSGILTVKLALAAIGYALVVSILRTFSNTGHVVLLGSIAGLSLFTANMVGAFTSYCLSRFTMHEVFSSTTKSVGFLVIWTAFCIFVGSQAWIVVAGIPLAEAINAIMLWSRCAEPIRFQLDRRRTIELLAESLPVGLMGAMVIVYLRLDNFFVFRYWGEAALGLYSIAYRSVEPFLMIPHSFATTLYSHLSREIGSTTEPKVNVRVVLGAMWPAYVFVAGASAGIVIAGRSFLAHWFPSYLSAFPVMRVLAILLIIRTANITLTAILCSFGRYKTLLRISGTNLLANLVFASALILPFGPLGASFAAFLTESWNCAVQWHSLRSCISQQSSTRAFESIEVGSRGNPNPAIE